MKEATLTLLFVLLKAGDKFPQKGMLSCTKSRRHFTMRHKSLGPWRMYKQTLFLFKTYYPRPTSIIMSIQPETQIYSFFCVKDKASCSAILWVSYICDAPIQTLNLFFWCLSFFYKGNSGKDQEGKLFFLSCSFHGTLLHIFIHFIPNETLILIYFPNTLNTV